MEGCEHCKGVSRLKVHRIYNTHVTQCYIVQCDGDNDGTIVMGNSIGDPAYIDINYCPMCGRDLRK